MSSLYSDFHQCSLYLQASPNLLKIAFFSMLKDPSMSFSTMATSKATSRSFQFIQKEIINLLNKFSSGIQLTFPGYNLHIVFSKEKIGSTVGIVYRAQVLWMLAASFYDSIEVASPFMGSIADYSVEFSNKSVFTQTFTIYFDLANLFKRCFIPDG